MTLKKEILIERIVMYICIVFAVLCTALFVASGFNFVFALNALTFAFNTFVFKSLINGNKELLELSENNQVSLDK